MALFRLTAGLTAKPFWTYSAAAVVVLLLVVAAVATRERNRVWFSEESLWRDSVVKNPRNNRALDWYGMVFFRQGDYQTAASWFEHSAAADPTCPICEANLLLVYVHLNRDDLAERHLERLAKLEPLRPDPYIAYADWLHSAGRLGQSGKPLERAAGLYRNSPELRQFLFVYYRERDYALRTPVFRALDRDHNLELSPAELAAAPYALAGLDRNGDGELSAEECGAPPAADAKRSAELMRSDPILNALDANHDGKLSAAEIRDATRALLVLDTDGDGYLEPYEIAPKYVIDTARAIMAAVDLNRDGWIDAGERSSPGAEAFRSLLDAADRYQQGIVTQSQLIDEIFYRADLNKDGIVTAEELSQAIQSGVLGPVPPIR